VTSDTKAAMLNCKHFTVHGFKMTGVKSTL